MSIQSNPYGQSTAYAFLLCCSLSLAGCGLTGTKGLVDSGTEDADIELLAETVPTNPDAELAQPSDTAPVEGNEVTQPALGRSTAGLAETETPRALTRVMPASTRSNLLKKPETPAPIPAPGYQAYTDSALQNSAPQAATPTPPAPPLPDAQFFTSATPTLPTVSIPAPAPRTVLKVGEANFDDVVLNSDVPVIVDFYADWCGPCKRVAPLLDQVARDNAGLRVVKVNIDDDKSLAREYRVQSIPTVMVFKQGKMIALHKGLPSIQKALRQ